MLAESARGLTGEKATEARAQHDRHPAAFNDGWQIVQHHATGFPFGHERRATATPEQVDRDNQGNDVHGGPWRRTIEDHHNAQECLSRAQIEWPGWSPGNVSR